jgi:hypothetical protein
MKTMMILLLSSVLCGGCALSSLSREPVTRTATYTQFPSFVYQAARLTLADMGAQVTQADLAPPTSGSVAGGHISSLVHGIVVLNVSVAAEGAGSVVTATGSLLPGKVVVGSLDEVDTFMTTLHERMARAH